MYLNNFYTRILHNLISYFKKHIRNFERNSFLFLGEISEEMKNSIEKSHGTTFLPVQPLDIIILIIRLRAKYAMCSEYGCHRIHSNCKLNKFGNHAHILLYQ